MSSQGIPAQSACSAAAIKGDIWQSKKHDAGCAKHRDSGSKNYCEEQEAANADWPGVEPHSKCSDNSNCGIASIFGKSGSRSCDYYCKQDYWGESNAVPCGLGIYGSNQCCKKEWCNTPLTYDDTISWCTANYAAPMTDCVKREGAQPDPVPDPAEVGKKPIKEKCDNVMRNLCQLGDNIVNNPSCVTWCREPTTNTDWCVTYMDHYCTKYPGAVECGCLQSKLSDKTLVSCFDAKCADEVKAYKTPAMYGTSQSCPNACIQIINATTEGSYSPILISDTQFKLQCSGDEYTKLQQIKKSQEQDPTAPSDDPTWDPDGDGDDYVDPPYTPTMPPTKTSTDWALIGSVVGAGAVVIVVVVVVVVALQKKKKHKAAATVPS